MEMPSSEPQTPEKNTENEMDIFNKKASALGWELVNDYGFWDGLDRFNPAGRLIYDGAAVYKNSEGQYADDYFVAELIWTNEGKRSPGQKKNSWPENPDLFKEITEEEFNNMTCMHVYWVPDALENAYVDASASIDVIRIENENGEIEEIPVPKETKVDGAAPKEYKLTDLLEGHSYKKVYITKNSGARHLVYTPK